MGPLEKRVEKANELLTALRKKKEEEEREKEKAEERERRERGKQLQQFKQARQERPPHPRRRPLLHPQGRGGSHANGRRARGQRFRRLLPQEGQQLAGSAPVRLKQSRWNTPLAPSTAFTTPNLTHDDMQTTNCSVERYSETPDFCFFDYNLKK